MTWNILAVEDSPFDTWLPCGTFRKGKSLTVELTASAPMEAGKHPGTTDFSAVSAELL